VKILMVDDDEALLSFFARQLERRGFETHQSVNGGRSPPCLAGIRPVGIRVDRLSLHAGHHNKGWSSVADRDPRDQSLSADGYYDRYANRSARPVLRKPFRIEQVLRLLRLPVLPL
jgi:hypothetical protein